MSETDSSAAAAEGRKPRRLRGHKKGAVTCCVASSSRPGVVASSGEVSDSARAWVFLPRGRRATPSRALRLPLPEQRVASLVGDTLLQQQQEEEERGALR
jgi:hypothetical protein